MPEVFICRSGDLKDGDKRIVSVRGGELEVGVYRHGGRYFAYLNLCAHQGGPACEGVLMPKVLDVLRADMTFAGQRFDESEMRVVCPWHGYEFKLETGECAHHPKLRLKRFNVIERDGEVLLAI